MGPLPNGQTHSMAEIQGGDPIAADSSPGMILQVIEEGFEPQPPRKIAPGKSRIPIWQPVLFRGANGKLAG